MSDDSKLPETHSILSKCKSYSTERNNALSIIVIGASGDLAKKKTFPALFHLFKMGLIPKDTIITGYARSKLTEEQFHAKVAMKFPDDPEKDQFLKQCFYHAGQYGSPVDWAAFTEVLKAKEDKVSVNGGNRLFYFAIPPTLFVDVGKGIQPAAMSINGWNRMIVEKPFGRDSASSAELGKQLSALFSEDQIYRIDHYLGKEMAQNLMTLRFANVIYEPIWNKENVQSVCITFKEPFGTQGRGGYFDSFGIIRDVLQNHLLQLLALIAMEPPASMDAEHVRDEKVRLLKCIAPITPEEMVVGQYKGDPKGAEPSYVEDPTVPDDSVTPTYACTCLRIDNDRWRGVPFFMKAGKALNERKCEIRIQFKKPKHALFKEYSNNELIMRVQPKEAVYLKMTTKKPGLQGGVVHTELDLSYHDRFQEDDGKELKLPDAYEQLIFECVRGDHNLFVRSDELKAAWNIFTPILHHLEHNKTKPILYDYGTRGPPEADVFLKERGFERTANYKWKKAKSTL